MKIGIITLPLRINIGGLLQAYALQTVLQRHGDNVVVFDSAIELNPNLLLKGIKILVRLFRRYFLRRKDIPIFAEYEYKVISQNTRLFIDKYIHRYEVNDYHKLHAEDFDVLVVGSDQIWRPSFVSHVEDTFFEFAQDWNIKRIAYAPSFGVDEWEYSDEQTENCSRLIKKFDLITVREDSAVALCDKHFGIKAKHVLDPTMLLNKEDYINIVLEAKTAPNSGDMLVYLLDIDQKYTGFVEEVRELMHYDPFFVNAKVADKSLPLAERVQVSVDQWLRGFMDAKFVLTDSFHACVFSIIFNVPFAVVPNEGGGNARIYSLLKMFELEYCFIEEVSKIADFPIVNWERVNIVYADKRVECLSLLYNSLK